MYGVARRVKYGKGYRMTEMTLMTDDFLDGIVGKDNQMEIRKKLRYLFSPDRDTQTYRTIRRWTEGADDWALYSADQMF